MGFLFTDICHWRNRLMCEGCGRFFKNKHGIIKAAAMKHASRFVEYVDLAQIVYLKILEWKQGQDRPDEVANNFLYTIASNAATDAYRKRKRNINRLQTSIYIYLRMLLTQILKVIPRSGRLFENFLKCCRMREKKMLFFLGIMMRLWRCLLDGTMCHSIMLQY